MCEINVQNDFNNAIDCQLSRFEPITKTDIDKQIH